METTINVRAQGIINGVTITLERNVKSREGIAPAVTELSEELMNLGGNKIEQVASIIPQDSVLNDLQPTVQLNAALPEQATLEGAPADYLPTQAVLEVLDTDKNKWAVKSHSVKEIQKVLMDLGVRGVSNYRNFDSVVRTLMSQGKLRREGPKRHYKYYLLKRVSA